MGRSKDDREAPMPDSISVLAVTALTIGLVHTAIGPDHYLPFIVLGKAEGWTLRKTVFWTAVCGLGHVASSILLGAIGIAVGWSVLGMESFEGVRGALAGWALIGFGALYFLWGLYKARTGGHSHVHVHTDGSVHAHAHDHKAPARAGHEAAPHDESPHVRKHRRTMWTLFIIFALGPCEPLIPLLMAPASEHSVAGIALVTGAFTVATVGTMVAIVTLGAMGLQFVRIRPLERFSHALSGAAIAASGLAINFLGL